MENTNISLPALQKRIVEVVTNYTTHPIPDHFRVLKHNLSYDLPFIAVAAVVIYSIRRWLTANLFQRLADRWQVKKSDRQRFNENAWFSVYYPFIVLFAYITMYNAPWLWSLDAIYVDYPHGHVNDEVKLPYLRQYYLVGLAFYTQALYALLFVDERMKDFKEMVVHHIATIILIFFSLGTVVHRFGSVVLLLHDAVDVFLYNAKMLHIAKFENLANTVFGVFALTFFALRLVLLPYITMVFCSGKWSHLYPSLQFAFSYIPNASTPFEVSSYAMCVNRYCVSSHYFLGILVVALICLHIYWFTLIVVVIKKVVAGQVSDPRQYEDQQSDDNQTTTETETTAVNQKNILTPKQQQQQQLLADSSTPTGHSTATGINKSDAKIRRFVHSTAVLL